MCDVLTAKPKRSAASYSSSIIPHRPAPFNRRQGLSTNLCCARSRSLMYRLSRYGIYAAVFQELQDLRLAVAELSANLKARLKVLFEVFPATQSPWSAVSRRRKSSSITSEAWGSGSRAAVVLGIYSPSPGVEAAQCQWGLLFPPIEAPARRRIAILLFPPGNTLDCSSLTALLTRVANLMPSKSAIGSAGPVYRPCRKQ